MGRLTVKVRWLEGWRRRLEGLWRLVGESARRELINMIQDIFSLSRRFLPIYLKRLIDSFEYALRAFISL